MESPWGPAGESLRGDKNVASLLADEKAAAEPLTGGKLERAHEHGVSSQTCTRWNAGSQLQARFSPSLSKPRCADL